MQSMPAQQSVTLALKLMQLLAPRIRKIKPVLQIQIHLVQLIVVLWPRPWLMVLWSRPWLIKKATQMKLRALFVGALTAQIKKTACFALGGALKAGKGWILKRCKLDCCTGNNCNTQTSIPLGYGIKVRDSNAVNPRLHLKCPACPERDAATCYANQQNQTCATDPNSLGSTCCASALIRYRDKFGKVLDGAFRGCLDCTSRKGDKLACHSLGGALKARKGWTLLKCQVKCCTTDGIPQTMTQTAITVFSPTAECHGCVESDAATCDKNQTTQYCDSSDYSLGTTHCASAVYKYRNKAGNVLDGFVRGCANCTVQKSASKKTLKRCPSCSTECPVALKKCKNVECGAMFPKKKKDWQKIVKRGKTSATHETEKLEYRADVLYQHHDYHIVILMHRKHGTGRDIYRYSSPGSAFQFVGDGTAENPPSKEGHLFINLFCSFIDAQKTRQNQPSSQTLPQVTTGGSSNNNMPNAEVVGSPLNASNNMPNAEVVGSPGNASNSTSDTEMVGNAGNSTLNTEVMDSPPNESSSMQNADAVGSPLNESSSMQNADAVGSPLNASNSTPGGEVVGNSPNASSSMPNAGVEGSRPNASSSMPNAEVEGSRPNVALSRTVVLYSKDGVDVAVGFLHQERRMLHGNRLPADFDVVQLTWVKERTIPAPLILGDDEENAILSTQRFFALPRKYLKKVKLINN